MLCCNHCLLLNSFLPPFPLSLLSLLHLSSSFLYSPNFLLSLTPPVPSSLPLSKFLLSLFLPSPFPLIPTYPTSLLPPPLPFSSSSSSDTQPEASSQCGQCLPTLPLSALQEHPLPLPPRRSGACDDRTGCQPCHRLWDGALRAGRRCVAMGGVSEQVGGVCC